MVTSDMLEGERSPAGEVRASFPGGGELALKMQYGSRSEGLCDC